MGAVEVSQAVIAMRIPLIVRQQPKLEDFATRRTACLIKIARPGITAEELESVTQALCHTALQRVVIRVVFACTRVGTGGYALIRRTLHHVADRVICRPIHWRRWTGSNGR